MNARLIVILLTFSIPAVLGQCNGNNGQLNFGDPVSSGSGNYESNADCNWDMPSASSGKVNALEFTSFHVEPADKFCFVVPSAGSEDICYVFPLDVAIAVEEQELYNTTFTLCANPGVDGGLKFTSDATLEYSGFEAVVREVDSSECDNPSIGGVFIEGLDPYDQTEDLIDGFDEIGFLVWLIEYAAVLTVLGCLCYCGCIALIIYAIVRASASPKPGYAVGVAPMKNPYDQATPPSYSPQTDPEASQGGGDIMVKKAPAGTAAGGSGGKRRSKGSKGKRRNSKNSRNRSRGSRGSQAAVETVEEV